MEQLVRETSRAFSVLDADTLEMLAEQMEECIDVPLDGDSRSLTTAREILHLQLQAASRSMAVRQRLNATASILTHPWAR